MTRVFLAGPIDFQDISDLITYRRPFRRVLEENGYRPVEQYSALFDRFAEIDTDNEDDVKAVLSDLESLPGEPYVEAIRHAIDVTSVVEVVESPELIPYYTPTDIISAIVTRDLELVRSCAAFLAYLPQPSCGTTVELMHARDHGLPTVVVSENPPLFIQQFADRIDEDIENAVDSLGSLVNRVDKVPRHD